MLILQILLWLFIAIAAILLFLALWLLSAPFAIILNTNKGVFALHWYSIGSIIAQEDAETFIVVKIRILFFKWEYNGLRLPKFPKKKKKDSVKKRSNLNVNWLLKKVSAVLLSFRVRKCYLNIDTGNPVYNAWLYPFLPWLNHRKNVKVNINWIGKEEVDIDVVTIGWRVLWAILKK